VQRAEIMFGVLWVALALTNSQRNGKGGAAQPSERLQGLEIEHCPCAALINLLPSVRLVLWADSTHAPFRLLAAMAAPLPVAHPRNLVTLAA
jgi:hypothetical protein